MARPRHNLETPAELPTTCGATLGGRYPLLPYIIRGKKGSVDSTYIPLFMPSSLEFGHLDCNSVNVTIFMQNMRPKSSRFYAILFSSQRQRQRERFSDLVTVTQLAVPDKLRNLIPDIEGLWLTVREWPGQHLPFFRCLFKWYLDNWELHVLGFLVGHFDWCFFSSYNTFFLQWICSESHWNKLIQDVERSHWRVSILFWKTPLTQLKLVIENLNGRDRKHWSCCQTLSQAFEFA